MTSSVWATPSRSSGILVGKTIVISSRVAWSTRTWSRGWRELVGVSGGERSQLGENSFPSWWITVQGCPRRSRARGFGAAERTVDGEDSSEIINGGKEGSGPFTHALKTLSSPLHSQLPIFVDSHVCRLRLV